MHPARQGGRAGGRAGGRRSCASHMPAVRTRSAPAGTRQEEGRRWTEESRAAGGDFRTEAAPLLYEVGFVADQHDNDVAAALRAHLLHPPRGVQEGSPIWGRDGARKRARAPLAMVPGGVSSVAIIMRKETNRGRVVSQSERGLLRRFAWRQRRGRSGKLFGIHLTHRTQPQRRTSRGRS